MSQAPLQTLIIDVAKQCMRRLVDERFDPPLPMVGSDNFFGWVPTEPLVRVSPDIFVLERPPEGRLPESFQTWREGHRPPLLAVEVVSARWRKDYDDDPDKYALLGVDELIIFDPAAASRPDRRDERVALQVYARQDDEAFALTYSGPGPAWSPTLEVWLLSAFDGPNALLRLAYDREGTQLVPTDAEVVVAERAAREAAEQQGRQDRAAREAAEREVAELRAQLAALDGQDDPAQGAPSADG